MWVDTRGLIHLPLYTSLYTLRAVYRRSVTRIELSTLMGTGDIRKKVNGGHNMPDAMWHQRNVILQRSCFVSI